MCSLSFVRAMARPPASVRPMGRKWRGSRDHACCGPPSPRRRAPPTPHGMTPQQTATRHPRNSPPSQALPTTHTTTRQGTAGGWGRVTHNTGNHRAPSPSPPLRQTDENDGGDVVHNDVDALCPVWLLVAPLLLCCSGLRHCMFIALLS